MQTKRNKFWTVVFSFLPGAGHMFMGFMKLGLSFMVLFFFDIFLASFFRENVLIFPLPIIWFYSFFDCINRMSADDEKFAAYEDNYLLPTEVNKLPFDLNGIFAKSRPIIGGLLIFGGVYIIVEQIYGNYSYMLTEMANNILSGMIYNLPRYLLAASVIIIGVKLIIGKKKEAE